MITALTGRDLAVKRGERLLFEGLDFDVRAGGAVVVTGPNGAGKTSLIRAVAGLIAPVQGRIGFHGPAGPIEPDEARRAGCHLIGHQDGLKGARAAREELLFWTRWTGGGAASAHRAAVLLGLERILPLEVRLLSAGQRRRLALARLIAAPRSLWLLDEPFVSLDGAARATLQEILRRHLEEGGMVFAASHEPLPVAAQILELGR
ncbi:MAG TPA: heme ABC exporter ATP-binding protein CcmA [Caulobacteraceae bacterium]|nr:heme ABC exporter ATP-binding protein CcmA [Caulobacteraceae bacterium]